MNLASRRSRRIAFAFVAGLVALGVTVLIMRRPGAPQPEATDGIPAVAVPAKSQGDAVSTTAPRLSESPDASALVRGEWDRLVADGAAAAARGPDAARAFVLGLFTALDALMPDDRIAVIYAFFASGRDVRFGTDFTVRAGGFLGDWPTLRVALLDYLAQRDGPAARVLAEQLLQKRPDEPGEWTLALRELTRGQPASAWPGPVTARLRDFITDEAWAGQSAASWLEGFDLVVAGRSAAFLTDLSAIAARDDAGGRSAQFAAFLAADRLVMASPAEMFSTLNRDPALFATQPNVRAGLFARADVRQPAQVGELEAYLARGDISAAERAGFAGFFPLYDLAVSNNLLTPVASRSLSDMIAHDRAALASIDRWLAQAKFQPWHGLLRETRTRLVEQLAQSGP